MWDSLDNASFCLQSFDSLYYSWQSQQVLGLPSALVLFVLVTFFYTLSIWNRTQFSLISTCLCVLSSVFSEYRWSHCHRDKPFFLLCPPQLCYYPWMETHLRRAQEIFWSRRASLCYISCHFHVGLSYSMFWLYLLCILALSNGNGW